MSVDEITNRRSVFTLPGGLVCAYPYCDLDGTPWPGCEHQHLTDDPVELAVIRGIAKAILTPGRPCPFVRAGERIETTWGCEKNKRKNSRKAVVTSITATLHRGRRSMWYRPAIQYVGKEIGVKNPHTGMNLTQIRRMDGVVWKAPESGGEYAPFEFRVEWVSPLTGKIERGPLTHDPGCGCEVLIGQRCPMHGAP